MNKFFILIILSIFLYSKNLTITKYIEDKPYIEINYKGDLKGLKLLKLDLKVLDHFIYKISDDKSKNRIEINFYNKKLEMIFYKENKEIYKKIYRINNKEYYPFLIHKAVYDLNKYYKLPEAKFLIRKVVFSLMRAPKDVAIYVSDYTLTLKKLIVNGGINIFPKWANKNQTAIYYTKLDKYANLYKLNLINGKREKILTSKGMLIVSDIKNDKLLITMAPEGEPDIFLFNIKTKKITKLTNYKGIDVNGKFWGNNDIVFVSNRYGRPYIFQKNINSNKVFRVLFQGKNQIGVDSYNNYLVISSRESNKAFKANIFNLFLVNKKDDSLRRLTMNGQNSFANFSVDGNSIMFIKTENFNSKLGIIRLKENKIFYYRLNKKLQSFDW